MSFVKIPSYNKCSLRIYGFQLSSFRAVDVYDTDWTLCKLEATCPEAAFIVAGDFNNANLRKTLPKFHQHFD